MDNKTVGYIIIGIALLISFVTYSFNRALNEIVDSICIHGDACPMIQTIDFQTNVSIGIIVFVILIGLYLIFFADKDQDAKSASSVQKRKMPANLNPDEKAVFSIIVDMHGSALQSNLVSKTGFSKVKITRVLDRLEGKGLIERRRRGMTNVVILKNN